MNTDDSIRIPDHERLRPIGSGSYGEVCLARNTLGAYRAIKIVRRSAFDHDRPYEREFNGIKTFEPISRESEGFVDILHVGRNESAGYFYYVMELADDIEHGQEIDPDKYVPHTLQNDITRRGRLPAEECLKIGIALSRALGDLHKRGRVHRDIKPANIVFIGGTAKLADIGLVTEAGEVRSFVGTEGYVPPEGPGTVRADIFSLGKVLYEISTGKDRMEFPDLPTDLRDAPDQRIRGQLNNIVLKACEDAPQKRYESAAAMEDDLLCLQPRGLDLPIQIPQASHRRWIRVSALTFSIVAAVMVLLPKLRFDHWIQKTQSQMGRGSNDKTFTKADSSRTAQSVAELEGMSSGAVHLRIARRLPAPDGVIWAQANMGDLYGQGEPILFAPQGDSLRVISQEGRILRRWSPSYQGATNIKLVEVLGINENERASPFLTWAEGPVLITTVLDCNFREYRSFTTKGAVWRSPFEGTLTQDVAFGDTVKNDTLMTNHRIVNLNPKGHQLLFMCVNTGYATRNTDITCPRGIVCYDFDSGKFLWNFATAPTTTGMEFLDLDADGTNDVVFGSYSTANGFQLPDGTDDKHCYLYGVSNKGTLLWRKQMSDYYTECVPFCISADGENSNRLFAIVRRTPEWANQATEQIGQVLRINSRGEIIAQYDAGAYIQSHGTGNIGLSSSPMILVTDILGNLHVLDYNLRLLRKVEVVSKSKDLVEMQIAGVCDVNGDGRNEIVLQSSQKAIIAGFDPSNIGNTRHYYDNCVLVLDDQLKVIDRFLVAPKWEQAPEFRVIVKQLAPQKQPQIVVLSRDALILEWATKAQPK